MTAPQQFRKKPVEIEALQFTDMDSYLAIVAWWKQRNTSTLSAEEMFEYRHPIMLLRTLEGTMSTQPGDWIIRGVQGEFYPCKPDIFAETYTSVADGADVDPFPVDTADAADFASAVCRHWTREASGDDRDQDLITGRAGTWLERQAELLRAVAQQ